MNWKVVIVTAIGLGLLEGVLSSRQNTANIGAAENGIVGLLQKFLDPATAAFTSVATKAPSTSSTAPAGSVGTPAVVAPTPTPSTTVAPPPFPIPIY